jgi:5-methyltetrahydrofolate--homocysteine methyltransferase
LKNKIFASDKITVFDGAMGTMLQNNKNINKNRIELAALENADIVTDVHKAYINAGANVIYANTFGANPKKLAKFGVSIDEVIKASIECAQKAVKECNKSDVLVALDVGP